MAALFLRTKKNSRPWARVAVYAPCGFVAPHAAHLRRTSPVASTIILWPVIVSSTNAAAYVEWRQIASHGKRGSCQLPLTCAGMSCELRVSRRGKAACDAAKVAQGKGVEELFVS